MSHLASLCSLIIHLFTCRQTILVSTLVKTGAIPASWKEYDLQEGLLNFLVVLEMLLFAITHYFVFSHKPYIDPAAAEVPCIATCLTMLDIRDVAGDVKEHFVDPLPRPRFRMGGPGRTNSSGSEGVNTTSTEDAPLLSKQKHNSATSMCINSHVTAAEVKSAVQLEKSALSELSYDVLTYKELDSRTSYGVRARMIANACREVTEEEEGGRTSTSSERCSGSSTPIEKSLSPARVLHLVAAEP